MAFNNEKFRLFWRFDSDAGQFVAVSTAQGYDIDNLKRDTLNSKWKSNPIVNLVTNGGFETGDFTGYLQSSAVIDNTNPASGTYCSKLVAAGASVNGPFTDNVTVEAGSVYSVSAKVDVDIYSAGTHRAFVQFRDSSDTLISSALMQSWTAITTGYETVTKTVGPASASPDINFPAGTAYMTVHVDWTGTPTGTAYLDDISVHISETITVTFGSDEVTNGGFETGDFTGWTQNNSTIDTTNPASGTYCAKLVTTGTALDGCRKTIPINPSVLATISAKVDVDILSAGEVRLNINMLDSLGAIISSPQIDIWTAATVGYETVVATVGPASASPDITYPAGTVSITVGVVTTTTPTSTVYFDDFSMYEAQAPDAITAFTLLDHDILSTDFLKLQYADDINFTIGVGTVTITHHDDTLIEYFTGVSKQFWRLIISPLITGGTREAGRLLLGDHYQMERNIMLGWSGPQYTQDTSRSARTEGGQSYTDIGTPLKTFQGGFTAHGETDLDELEALKSIMLTGQSFVISQNWEDFPIKRTLYGKLRSLGQPSNVAADKWSLPFSMVEQK